MDRQDELDALFAEARATAPPVPPALMERILADARTEQPRPGPGASPVAAPTPATGWFWGWFGSGGLAAGLVSVTLAGFLVGFAQPAPLTALADALGSNPAIDSLDLIPSLPGLLTEETP